MDWVHCNSCFTQPGESERKKFFITNCGHIYCNECLEKNQSNECRICHIKFTTIPLTSKMSSEVEVYFHDPVIILKKQAKILEFQQSHRIRLISHNQERLKNYQVLRRENYNLSEELRKCREENVSLVEEIKRVKADLHEFKKKIEREISEMSLRRDQSKASRTPQMGSFNHFLNKELIRRTPTMSPKNEFRDGKVEGNFSSEKKRSNSNFFLMTETRNSEKYGRNFSTPDLPKFLGNYRSQKILTPDIGTPPTPETIIRELNQRDPLQRRTKFPSSRSGPSPSTRLGLHGLTLSRPSSTPIKENYNKYLKYFK